MNVKTKQRKSYFSQVSLDADTGLHLITFKELQSNKSNNGIHFVFLCWQQTYELFWSKYKEQHNSAKCL